MVRFCACVQRNTECSPHTRGDGPAANLIASCPAKFSPHTWGWSAYGDNVPPLKNVLPTHVGMVRGSQRQTWNASGSPHTRGDGPDYGHETPVPDEFSPHTWGWSGDAAGIVKSFSVLPTHVGMVRVQTICATVKKCSPHTRGDGPYYGADIAGQKAFSPHTWGWSEKLIPQHTIKHVLPTHVGMVRISNRNEPDRISSPHTRGDGPRTRRRR